MSSVVFMLTKGNCALSCSSYAPSMVPNVRSFVRYILISTYSRRFSSAKPKSASASNTVFSPFCLCASLKSPSAGRLISFCTQISTGVISLRAVRRELFMLMPEQKAQMVANKSKQMTVIENTAVLILLESWRNTKVFRFRWYTPLNRCKSLSRKPESDQNTRKVPTQPMAISNAARSCVTVSDLYAT